MATNIINLSPTSPGQRFASKMNRKEIYKGKPFRRLTKGKMKTGGRNNQGRITTRHIGGGHKRKLRFIDFKRNDKDSMVAKVKRLEYDPNRSAYIALIVYADGEWRYIIGTEGLKVGSEVISGAESRIKVGNCLPLANIPIGSTLHCVEMKPKGGAKLARSAGSYVQLIAREGLYAILRLPSGETRKILATCRATLGTVGNADHNLRCFGKAGARRHLGIRPTVRGSAMNPIDHPLGGGEGKTGLARPSVNFKGNCVKGFKTRRNKRTDRFILQRKRGRLKGRERDR